MAVRRLGVGFCHLLPGPAPWNLLPKLSGRRLPGRRSRQKVPWFFFDVSLFGSSFSYDVSVFTSGLASSQTVRCCQSELLNTFENNDYSWEGFNIFLNAAMRKRFQEYMQGPQWHSKTMIVAERGWHLPQCRYVIFFQKYMRPLKDFRKQWL